MWKIINKLRAIKLTIVLMIVIILLSIIGTLIPQNAGKWKYVELFGHHGYALIKYGQLQDVYHSWWYLGILCLLSLNVLSCMIYKTKIRNKEKFKILSNFKLYQEYIFDKKVENIESKIKETLTNFKYTVNCKNEEGFWSIYAKKGSLNRIGYYLTHVSLLLILLGGLVGSLWGYKSYLKISVGEATDIPKSNFKVRADDFQIKYYPNSSNVLSYESKLTVIEKGEEKLTKLVRVNHPLRYKGFDFYQNSYGTSKLWIKVTDKKGKGNRYLVDVGSKIKLGKNDLYLKVEQFLPDLIIKGTEIYSKTQNLNNPAAKIGIYRNKKDLIKSFWLFYKYPDYHRNITWNKEDLSFRLAGMKPYTELQIAKDRGLYLVYGGFLFLMIGITFSLFIPFRKIYASIRRDEKGTKIEVAGKSLNRKREMEDEFALIVEEIVGNN
ncbi:MAG: cytochrome c biogenesis protein ResB [bacterium]|nr:cytochrome c biogenesis protein ResB [bacterium]